jgi:iron-sulfur cluster repair protein YtfE (RIC family)
MMLVSLGKKPDAVDAVSLLLECHERIRKFLGFARTLASAQGATDAEVSDVAGQIRRYFAESLPLHIADEHENILPMLAGSRDEVTSALATMDADHELHEPIVSRLVELCDMLQREPQRLGELSSELADVAGRLSDELGSHLALEERVILPALRQLPAAQLDGLRAAMRVRRQR